MINLNFKRKSKVILVGILFGIGFLAMLPIQSNFNQNERITQNPISSASVPHAPILIADETALLAFVASETLDGAGSESDPYVIEDYIIDCGGSGIGIEILTGITSHVFIKNCEIRNGTDVIRITETPNVDVSNCTIESMLNFGIVMEGFLCMGSYIENCYVNGSFWGIAGAYDGKVSNCVVSNVYIGFICEKGIIEKSIVYNTDFVIFFDTTTTSTIIRQCLFFNYSRLFSSGADYIVWDDNVLGIDGDGDGDGISDHDEYLIYGTDRFLIDTDMDNYHDGYEILSGFDPLDNSSPTAEDLGILVDTDGDGYYDGFEVQSGTDPLDPNDYPGVGEDEPSGIPGYSLVFLTSFALLGLILIYSKTKLQNK